MSTCNTTACRCHQLHICHVLGAALLLLQRHIVHRAGASKQPAAYHATAGASIWKSKAKPGDAFSEAVHALRPEAAGHRQLEAMHAGDMDLDGGTARGVLQAVPGPQAQPGQHVRPDRGTARHPPQPNTEPGGSVPIP